jgi:hypothetical protein
MAFLSSRAELAELGEEQAEIEGLNTLHIILDLETEIAVENMRQ